MSQDAVVLTVTSKQAPRRYGDAGAIRAQSGTTPVERPARSRVYDQDNARVVATCARDLDDYELMATCDVHDRAHGEYERGGPMLKPAADSEGRPKVFGATPRRYPLAYMVGSKAGPVSFETSYESVGEVEDWLRKQLGVTAIPRMDAVSELVRTACRHVGKDTVKAQVEGRDRWTRMTDEERTLEAAADRILAGRE